MGRSDGIPDGAGLKPLGRFPSCFRLLATADFMFAVAELATRSSAPDSARIVLFNNGIL